MQCTPDVIVDGNTASLGNFSWPTTTVGPHQTCPGWFWLEVENPQGFFAQGAAGRQTYIDLESVSQSACTTDA